MKPVLTTTSQFLRDIMALDFRFTAAERTALLARAKRSIEESTRLMNARLLAMPVQTDRIQ